MLSTITVTTETRAPLPRIPAALEPNGTLYVSGTGGADDIAVGLGKNGRLHVVVNGSTTQFRIKDVKRITIDAAGGNDHLWARRQYGALTKPITMLGGNGNDTLLGGDGADVLAGGRGRDSLNGNGGADRILGGGDSDHIDVSDASDFAEGLEGQDYIVNAPSDYGGTSNGVNFPDLLALSKNYKSNGNTWGPGDFNYDGAVNFPDLLALAKNYNNNILGGDWALGGSTISADIAAAESARQLVVVSDAYSVLAQTETSKSRVRVDFALGTDTTGAFSLNLLKKSVVIIATQTERLASISFANATDARLATSGGAYIVGSNKRYRLKAAVDPLDAGDHALRVIGGKIILPASGAFARFEEG